MYSGGNHLLPLSNWRTREWKGTGNLWKPFEFRRGGPQVFEQLGGWVISGILTSGDWTGTSRERIKKTPLSETERGAEEKNQLDKVTEWRSQQYRTSLDSMFHLEFWFRLDHLVSLLRVFTQRGRNPRIAEQGMRVPPGRWEIGKQLESFPL